MPFCSQCGNPVGPTQAYCARCGAAQPLDPAAANPLAHDPLSGLTPRTASILCYIPVMGWIAAIVVLASQRYRHMPTVRFHAFQGLYLFAAWLVVDWVVGPIMRFTPGPSHHVEVLLQAVILAVSIFMMIKASHGEPYVLPIIGELAQRSATEQ